MRALEFNEWMLKMGNIYYANNHMMTEAYAKIIEHEKL
tara:strand:+ start:2397 stop:2510 length:114 start_codon:yes stop_codon:yes gene_type:complete